MKFIVTLLLTALLAFAAGLYLPWWSVGAAAFLVALLIHQKPGKAFVGGFVSIFLLWGVSALIIDIQNHQLLSGRIAEIFPLEGSSTALILITAFIGGLVAGLAALSGSLAREPISANN